MKKLTLFAVILLAATIAATGCKKAGKAPEKQAPAEETQQTGDVGATVTPEKIATDLSNALCKKMVEFGEGVVTEGECVTQTKTSLMEALTAEPIQISQKQLNDCLGSINTGDKDTIFGTEPPQYCEWLK